MVVVVVGISSIDSELHSILIFELQSHSISYEVVFHICFLIELMNEILLAKDFMEKLTFEMV